MGLRFIFISILLISVPALAGFKGLHVKKEEYGYKWPFTVPEGYIQCKYRASVVFLTPEGKTYAVNGTARGGKEKYGWRDFMEIWRDDPKYPGLELKVNIGWVIEQGLKRCK